MKPKTQSEQLYIRFGEIPENEQSGIYDGYEKIGVENGVSVYPAFKDINGNYVLGLSLPLTATTLDTQQGLLKYDNRKCYILKGDYVGKGKDGEPLIKNVEIIEEITNYRERKTANFKYFDPQILEHGQHVLIRKGKNDTWKLHLYTALMIQDGTLQVIPYNDDTKHLFGTTDTPPDYYNIFG